MPEKVMCKKCRNLVRGWCREKLDSPDPNIERDCRDFKEKTNADRIRAMTDEEMVVFLDWLTNNCAVCNENHGSNEECPIYKEGHYCRPKDIMNWLRQPVKED